MNQENKKQIILAGILGVVLVGVLLYQFLIAGGAPPPKAGSAPKAQTAGTSTAVATRPNTPPARLQKVDVDLDKLLKNIEVVTFIYDNERISRNPMTPLVGRIFASSERTEASGPVVNEYSIREKAVSGIIYNEFNPVAIIDDEVVTEGHQYADGVVVTQIEPKRVWFQWRDSLIPVELKEL